MNDGNVLPEQHKSRSESSIAQFAVKTGIVAAACFLVFVFTVMYLDSVIDSRVEQFRSATKLVWTKLEAAGTSATKLGGRDFWTKLERELDNQASPAADLPAAKKKKILAEIRVVADRWRPFVKEALSAITGETEKPAAP